MLELLSGNGDRIIVLRLWFVLKKKFLIVLLAGLLVGGLTYVGVHFFVTPRYEASSMLYVNNMSYSYKKGETEMITTSSDINASRSLTDTVIVILKNSSVLDEVIKQTGIDYTYKELLNSISVEASDGTEVLKVTVNTESPRESARIADTIATVLSGRITDIIEGSSTKIVANARINENPVSPRTLRDAALAAFIVMLLVYAFFVIADTLHQTIEGTAEIVQNYPDIPLLGEVPDLNGDNGKSNYYYYSYGKKNKKSDDKKNNRRRAS